MKSIRLSRRIFSLYSQDWIPTVLFYCIIFVCGSWNTADATSYVEYQPCTEYIYKIQAKASLQGAAHIVLKAKIGFEALYNVTPVEIRLNVHDARMEQGVQEVHLAQTMNIHRWFSAHVNSLGEVTNVMYPQYEDFNTIALKKTFMSYVSGKFNHEPHSLKYDVEETDSSGTHGATYERQHLDEDVIFVKEHHRHNHPAAKHGRVTSSKTTTVNKIVKVPQRIILHENIELENRQMQPKAPKFMGRNKNYSEEKAHVPEFPIIAMRGVADIELIDVRHFECATMIRPPDLVHDDLAVIVDEETYRRTRGEDFSETMHLVYDYIDGNITCMEEDLQKVVPSNSKCFSELLKLLEIIPDEYFEDVMANYFTEGNNLSLVKLEQKQVILMDAVASLRTEISQQILFAYFFNQSEQISWEILHRLAAHFTSFDQPPIPEIVNVMEELAFHPRKYINADLSSSDVDHHNGVMLALGSVVNIMIKSSNESQRQEGHRIRRRIEEMTGFHDPHHWKMHRSRRSVEDYKHLLMRHSVVLEALGNVGSETSVEIICSHMNHTDTPYQLRRAAIGAMRHFHCDKSAEMLMQAALFEEELSLQDEALHHYLMHPQAVNIYALHDELQRGFLNGTYPHCPKELADSDQISLPHHVRVRRNVIWKGIQFRLATPPVDWAKRFGNSFLGASMGLRIRNELDVDIKLQKGKVKVDIDDHAYAIAHIGWLGQELSVLDAKVCLIGGVEYEVNLLQEFGFDDVEQLVRFWDRFQNGVVKNIKQGVEGFRQFFSGVRDFHRAIRDLDRILDELPQKVRNLRRHGFKMLMRIGEISDDEVPPFARPLKSTIERTVNLYNDVKTDVMTFYNSLVDTVKIHIPMCWRQIREGVQAVGQSIRRLFKSPKEAISGMFKAVAKVKAGIDGLLDAKNRVKEACFFTRENKPYWWDMKAQLKNLEKEYQSAWKIFLSGVGPYMKQSRNKVEHGMRQEVVDIFTDAHNEILQPFKDLQDLAFPFVNAASLFTTTVEEVKEAYQNLKTAYQEAQAIIDRLFGPKAYIEFPRTMRSPGSGCDDYGTYPASENRYGDPGVDLVAEAGKDVKAPFDGTLSRLSDRHIRLIPDGSSVMEMEIIISNVQAVDSVPSAPKSKRIYKSDIMGRVTSSACVNHIHVAMKEKGVYVDPTRFLSAHEMKMPIWTEKCDEYKLVFLGKTLQYGRIIRSTETPDTSPKRSSTEPENVDLPKPADSPSTVVKYDGNQMMARNVASDNEDQSVIDKATKQWDKFTQTMGKFFDFPDDLGLKDFFQKFNINKIRLGTMVGLLHQLNMVESKAELVTLIQEFINLQKSPRCLLPQQMSTEQLQIELARRGVFTNESRTGMIHKFYDLNTQCALHMPALPKKAACFFDEKCIGLECCIEAKLGIFVKSTKAYLRLDPCTLTVNMGVEIFPYSWTHSFKLFKISVGEEEEKLTNVKMKIFGDEYRLKTRIAIQNDENCALLQFSISLCSTDNEEFCLPRLVIFNDLLLPLPTCDENGVVYWPKINVQDFLSRENIIRELKKVKTNVKKSSREIILAYLENKLDLPSGFLEHTLNDRCESPHHMTKEQLLQQLPSEEVEKAKRLTNSELQLRVSSKMRTCRWFQMLPFVPEIASNLFCSISADCYSLRCCFELPLPIVNETFTLSAYTAFDPCQFSFSYGVGNIQRTVLLLDYEWGTVKEWNFGVMKINYSISRDIVQKVFSIKVGMSLCLKGEKRCLVNGWILDNHVIPIPLCNENFTNCFQDVIPLEQLVEKGVKARTQEAMWTVLRCLDLDRYLMSDIGCPGEDETVCSTSSLKPRVLRTCGKDLPCWSVQCNLKLNLFLMEKNVCVWFAFNPCTYDMQIGLGAWNYTDNLMKEQEFGVMKTKYLTKLIRMNYKFQHSSDMKHFIVDLSFSVCYKKTCTPTQSVLDKVYIPKPLCADESDREIPGGSLPEFIKWLSVNSSKVVAKLAVERALTHLGVKDCLSDSGCIFGDAVTVDGWDNRCPTATLIPKLPSWTRCSFNNNCGKVQCCLDFDIFIWQGSLKFEMDLDICSSRLNVHFENCHHTIEPIKFDVEQKQNFSPNVTLSYLFERDNALSSSTYLVSVKLRVCQFKCSWLEIFQQTRIQWNCPPSNPTSLSFPHLRRGRRSLMASDPDLLVKQIGSKIPGMLDRFDELVKEGKQEAKQSYLELQKSMSKLYETMYDAKTPMKTVFVTPPDSDSKAIARRESASILARPSIQWNWDVIPPSGGAELFEIKRGPKGQLLFEVGRGLTEAGIAILGDALANMTIGDLEATVDYDNIDPIVAFRILRQVRKLYFTLVSEAIDVFFNGKMDDKVFNSFDYVIRGSMGLPRRHVRYFQRTYYFFVFPVPCLFSLGFGADGYWGVDFSAEFRIISMLARGTVDPYVGLVAYGFGAADCVVFKGEVRLNGYIMETHLPSTVEVGFYKFPLDVGLNVDIVIIPLRLELTADVKMRVLFFMKRKRRFIRIRVRRIGSAIRRVVNFIGKVVGGIIRVVQQVFRWKQLFHKVLWTWSMEPWTIPGIIHLKRKEEDRTPPQFNRIDMSDNGHEVVPVAYSNTPSTGCVVEQMRGRPYTEPAIWLRADPTDDVSKVRMFFSIGSTPGGVDIANNFPFAGPEALLENLIVPVTTLHFTITGSNSQGLQSQTSCILEKYDIQPPQGKVTIPYHSSSSNQRLEFTATIEDTSDIVTVLAAVGYGPGIVGDNVRRWAPVSFRRLPSPPNAKTQNYVVSVTFTNLQLIHGQLHFINLLVHDSMGYSAILSSNPVITDFTPPSAPIISNITRVESRSEKCSDLLLDKWKSYCTTTKFRSATIPVASDGGQYRRVVNIPNHQTLIDGYGNTSAIFNGETPLKDLKWTSNNHYLSTNFEPFHDNETDILGYTICFGRSLCSCDAFGPFDPHESAAGREEWNFKGYAVLSDGRTFPDGKYFVTIGALNRAQVSGPYRTTVCHWTPQIVDTSPPVIDSVTKLSYDMNNSLFSAHIKASDMESGLKLIKLGAGLTKHDLSVSPLKLVLSLSQEPIFFDGRVVTPLTIQNGQRIYVHVLVSNNVNLNQEFTSPRPFLVDNTPPIAGEVFIGPRDDRSTAYFKHFSELCVSWHGFHDLESGIDSYQVSLERCHRSDGNENKCSETLQEWSNVAPSRHQLCLSSHMDYLQHNVTYRATITAFNGGHARLNVTAWSTTILYDVTPPLVGSVIDGNLPIFQIQRFTSMTASYSLQWQSSWDPESSIRAYSVKVMRNEQPIRNIGNVKPTSQSLHVEGLHLQHNDRVKSILMSENGAGAVIERRTDGLIVDLTPPVIVKLYHPSSQGDVTLFQTRTDSLSVMVQCSDPESDISSIRYQVYEWIDNHHHNLGTEQTLSTNDGEIHIIDKLGLISGKKYGVRYTVRNGAGLSTVRETNGVIVDDTPPLIVQVRLHHADDDDTEFHDNIVWQHKDDEISIILIAMDPESGIDKIYIDIGTTPLGHDIVNQREFHHSDSFIRVSNLSLSYWNDSLNSPLYYVSVNAVNHAGLFTSQAMSAQYPLAVVKGDSPGTILHGPNIHDDWQWQMSADVMSGHFHGVESPLHGIQTLLMGVGSEPGLDDILSFSEYGFINVNKDNSAGFLHAPVNLENGKRYFFTLEAVTGAQRVLRTVSSGVWVHRTPPVTTRIIPSRNETVYYINSNPSSQFSWTSQDSVNQHISSTLETNSHPLISCPQLNSHDQNMTKKHQLEDSISGLPISFQKSVNHTRSGEAIFVRACSRNEFGLLSFTKPTIAFVMDDSPPEIEDFHCDRHVVIEGNTRTINCGVRSMTDKESPIVNIMLHAVNSVGSTDPPYMSWTIPLTKNDINLVFHATSDDNPLPEVFVILLNVKNAASLQSYTYSGLVQQSSSTPQPGFVVHLGDYVAAPDRMLVEEMITFLEECHSPETCKRIHKQCVLSYNKVVIAWSPFKDDVNSTFNYDVALGRSPNGSGIVYWTPVRQKFFVFQNIDLRPFGMVYASVRGKSLITGRSVISSSSPIYLSYLATQSYDPSTPLISIFDGDNILGTSSFTNDPMTMRARWDVSNEPCPLLSVQWKIERIDGKVIQNYTEMGSVTQGIFFGLNAENGDTFFNYLKVTSVLNMTFEYRSSGITVRLEPIVPGDVYDGLILGRDLNWQSETNRIAANWRSFHIPIHEGGVVEEGQSFMSIMTPQIDYYEVAVGTDRRGDPATMSNVVPFTNVGLNTSVQFHGLTLHSQAIYYVTVIAHSRWFTSAQSSSNGIRVGELGNVTAGTVHVVSFISQTNQIAVKWSSFKSSSLQTYFIGMKSYNSSEWHSSTAPLCDTLLPTVLNEQYLDAYFDVYGVHDVGQITSITLIPIHLRHNTIYDIRVIALNNAGLCAMSNALVKTDFTPPQLGQLQLEGRPSWFNPETGKNVKFVRRESQLKLEWDNFVDEESGIVSYKLTLWESNEPNCHNLEDLRIPLLKSGLLAEFHISGNRSSFEMEELILNVNHAYFVELEAVNAANLKSVLRSEIILLEAATIRPGSIIVGEDYANGILYLTSPDNVTVNLLHTTSANKDELIGKEIQTSQWIAKQSRGFTHTLDYAWPIYFSHEMTHISEEFQFISVKLQRQVQAEGVYSGAVSSMVDDKKPHSVYYKIYFQLQTAPGPYAVTSVTLSDPNLSMKDESAHRRLVVDALDANELAVDSNDQEEELTPLRMTKAACLRCCRGSAPQLCMCDCPPVEMSVPKETYNTLYFPTEASFLPVDATHFTACGLQFYQNSNVSQCTMIMWCKRNMSDETESPRMQKISLSFDPSAAVHRYGIEMNKNVLGSNRLTVLVDGKEIGEITGGIPTFQNRKWFSLQLWNNLYTLPPIGDPFKPYEVSASLHGLSIQSHKQELFEYGPPFMWTEPMKVTYEARILLSPDVSTHNESDIGNDTYSAIYSHMSPVMMDIMEWTEMATTCIPCDETSLSTCARVHCQKSCKTPPSIEEMTYTFFNVEFENVLNNTTEIDEGGNTTINMTRFVVEVRVETPGGYTTSITSLPITVDFTAPEADLSEPWSYYDVASKDVFVGVRYQSSNDTIRVQWNIYDSESGVAEYEWAIGSYPGGTDIMDFESVGENTTAERRGLQLRHNHTYYASVSAANKAGLVSTYNDGDGVIVLSEPPSVDKVNVTLPNTAPLPDAIDPEHTTKLTLEADEISVVWEDSESGSNGESLTKSEFCVGSSHEEVSDVLDCIPMERNSTESMKLTFRNGHMEKNNEGAMANISDLLYKDIPRQQNIPLSRMDTDGMNGRGRRALLSSDNQQKEGGMRLEPGKHLFYHLRLCNMAMKCSEKPTQPVLVGDPSMVLISTPTSSTVSRREVPVNEETQSKVMSYVKHFSQPIPHLEARHYRVNFKIESPSVSSLFAGLTNSSIEYQSDGVLHYKSYIVDPMNTIHLTSRDILNRVRRFINPPFYITPLQQIEQGGPIVVSIDLLPSNGESLAPSVGEKLSLIYWHKEKQWWTTAEGTCPEHLNVSTVSSKSNLQVPVCFTQSETSETSSVQPISSVSSPQYFKYETEFLLTYLSEGAVNTPPKLLNADEMKLVLDERVSSVSIQLKAVDAEGDPFKWFIIPPLPQKGIAIINELTGLLSYTANLDAVGMDFIWVRLRDYPTMPGIPSAQTDYKIPVLLNSLFNPPYLIVQSIDGTIITMKETDTAHIISLMHFIPTENNTRCVDVIQLSLLSYGEYVYENGTYFLYESSDNLNVSLNKLGFSLPKEHIGNEHLLRLHNSTWIKNHLTMRPAMVTSNDSIDISPDDVWSNNDTESNFTESFIRLNVKDSRGFYSKPIHLTIMWQEKLFCPWTWWMYFLAVMASAVAMVILAWITAVIIRKIYFRGRYGVQQGMERLARNNHSLLFLFDDMNIDEDNDVALNELYPLPSNISLMQYNRQMESETVLDGSNATISSNDMIYEHNKPSNRGNEIPMPSFSSFIGASAYDEESPIMEKF